MKKIFLGLSSVLFIVGSVMGMQERPGSAHTGMSPSYSGCQLSSKTGMEIAVKPRPNSAPSQYEFSKKDSELFKRVARTMVAYEQKIKHELRDSDRYIDIVSHNREVIDFAIHCYGCRQRQEDIYPIFGKIRELVNENEDVYDDLHLLKILDLAASKRTDETIAKFEARSKAE
ncbi:MAG: hypothetical protein LBG04_02820 [Holosporaceae bacterium]|jgi:hypothetical protein|nr:hypothetical protein [Holosporaceae bacterium]